MTHDRARPADVRADITSDGTPDEARGHAFGEIGDTDHVAPSPAEGLDRVQRAGIAGTSGVQIDPAGRGAASGEIRRRDAPEQVARTDRERKVPELTAAHHEFPAQFPEASSRHTAHRFRRFNKTTYCVVSTRKP